MTDLRHDPDGGRAAVHFPRLGYDWRRAQFIRTA